MVRRNDEATLGEVEALLPSHIILSPGPCSPAEAGISTDIVRASATHDPDSGRVPRPPVHRCRLWRGRRARLPARSRPHFADRPRRLQPVRGPPFASPRRALPLTGDRADALPPSLRVIASAADDGEVMAVEHRTHPVVGVQFHPESAASEYGYAMLDLLSARHAFTGGRASQRCRRRRQSASKRSPLHTGGALGVETRYPRRVRPAARGARKVNARIRRVLETALYCDDLTKTASFYQNLLNVAPMLATERLVAFDAGGATVLLLFQRGRSRQPLQTSGGLIPAHDGSGPHILPCCDVADLTDWEARLASSALLSRAG